MGILLRRFGLVAFLAALVLAPPVLAFQDAPANNPDAETLSLKGTVVDSATGEPIHAALVQVNGAQSRVLLTGTDGKFDFEGLRPGIVVVQPRKPGYFSDYDLAPERQHFAIIDLEPSTSSIVLKLIPEGVIFGRITTENGEPLDGLTVGLLRSQIVNGRKRRDQVAAARTDEDGNFRIPELQPGDYYLYAGASSGLQFPPTPAPGKSPQGFPATFYPGVPDVDSAAEIPVKPGSRLELNFSPPMHSLYEVSGIVTGFLPGRPVNITVLGETGDSGGSEIQFDQQTGIFQVHSIPAGPYTVEAVCEGSNQSFFAGIANINVNSNVTGVRLPLAPDISIPVVVSFGVANAPPEGRARGVYIQLFPTDPAPINMAGGSSDGSDGGIHGLLPGSYSTQISPQGPWYVASATYGSTDLLRDPLVIAPGGAAGKIFVEVRDDGATLTGTLADSGQPTAGRVIAIPDRAPEHPQLASTDENGNFQFHMLAPGNYRLLAFDRLDGLEYANPIALQAYATKEKEIALGSNGRESVQLDLIRKGD